MKPIEQIVEIKNEKQKEQLKQFLKTEYEYCIEHAKHCSERLELKIKDFIEHKTEGHFSLGYVYAREKELELTKYIAKFYKELFGEEISEKK